jgi:hypothetical protein
MYLMQRQAPNVTVFKENVSYLYRANYWTRLYGYMLFDKFESIVAVKSLELSILSGLSVLSSSLVDVVVGIATPE